MNRVLLTVSGVIAPGIEEQVIGGHRPRSDYLEMARAFGADLVDFTEARRSAGWFGRLLEKMAGPFFLVAWVCFRRRASYDIIFTDGEQVGIPLALMCKLRRSSRPRHLMIAHYLSVGKKMVFFDLFRIQSHIDTFFVYSSWQKRFIEQRWKVLSDRVVFTPFMVDADFFSPQKVTPNRRRMICAVGLEFRDYPMLIEAIRALDVEVIIAAASPWSKRGNSMEGTEIPKNVTVRRYSQLELRQVYADSSFVVMPLYDVNFQAGVTAILEAMAMERAVICSRTSGQTDVIVDGETGIYVPPSDPSALRKAIERLLNSPHEADRMGENGRKRIVQEMSLDHYVARLDKVVQAALSASKVPSGL